MVTYQKILSPHEETAENFSLLTSGVAFTSYVSITKQRNHASNTGESTFIANSGLGIHGI